MRRMSYRYSISIIILMLLGAGCLRIPLKKRPPTPVRPTLQSISPRSYVGLDLTGCSTDIYMYSLIVAETETGEKVYENIKIVVPHGGDFRVFVDEFEKQVIPKSYQMIDSKVLSNQYPKQMVKTYSFETNVRVQLAFEQKPKAKAILVIDDLGYNEKALPFLLGIKRPITLAVLPHITYSQKTAQTVHEHGYEVIVHLPMQPESKYAKPGPGVVTVDMSDQEIKMCVENAINNVPYAIGINNHMGSLATKDPRVMRAVLETLKSKKMFFLDSKTGISVASKVAEKLGMHVYNRDIFLDNTDEKEYIKARLNLLLSKAQKIGTAIGIGHFRVNTMIAIREMLVEFDKAEVELIFLSQLYQEDPQT